MQVVLYNTKKYVILKFKITQKKCCGNVYDNTKKNYVKLYNNTKNMLW